MTPFWKTLAFWISACAWLASVGGHYAKVVPPPCGLFAADGVAVAYAVLRCLRKRQSGATWKGILYTSEFAMTVLTLFINFAESLTKVPSLSPRALQVASGVLVLLVSALHTAGGKAEAGWPEGAEVKPEDLLSGAENLGGGGLVAQDQGIAPRRESSSAARTK